MTLVKKLDLITLILDTPHGKSMSEFDKNLLATSLKSMDIAFLEKSLVKFKKRSVKKTKTNKSSGAILKSSPPPKRPNFLVKESKTIIKKPENKVKESKTIIKKPKPKDKEPRTIAQAKKMGKDYFMVTDKKGNDIKKAAVTAEELKKSGLSLRDYLNKKRGLKRKTKK
jgi:hypothetical protein